MGEWQDIETAPKDGTPIMLAIAGTKIGRFPYIGTGRWTVEGPHYVGWDGSALGIARILAPTHWMPIPPPPSFEEQ